MRCSPQNGSAKRENGNGNKSRRLQRKKQTSQKCKERNDPHGKYEERNMSAEPRARKCERPPTLSAASGSAHAQRFADGGLDVALAAFHGALSETLWRYFHAAHPSWWNVGAAVRPRGRQAGLHRRSADTGCGRSKHASRTGARPAIGDAAGGAPAHDASQAHASPVSWQGCHGELRRDDAPRWRDEVSKAGRWTSRSSCGPACSRSPWRRSCASCSGRSRPTP